MTTEATTRAEALAELAAIRAAAPLYVGKAAPTEAEAAEQAEAEAATTGYDTTGKLALGAIVEQGTAEAAARAAEARKLAGITARAARAELPARAIEWRPAPIRKLTEAEQAAARAEARWHASIARELHTVELAEARQARARQARRDAVAGNAETMFAELTEAELEAADRKAGARGKLAEARARAAFLAASGMTEAEARAMELLAEETEETVGWAAPDAVPTRKARKDAGMPSRLSPAELAAVAEWTEAGLSSPAARAGRAALGAIGPVASGMILTSRKARKVTVMHVMRAPKVPAAEARVARAEQALEAARARQAEAEARVAAAEATGAVPAIRKAEAEANRLAELTRKAAARAELADSGLAEARKLAKLPASHDGLIAVPVESFKLAEAGRAAELALPRRHDAMPARYREQGPQAKGMHYRNDPVPAKVLGDMMALSEAELRDYWEETWQQINDLLAAKRAAEQAEAEAARAESEAARKAYKAAHERGRRERARKAK